MEERELDDLLERGWSLERIGRWFGRDPSTVSYWMAKYGLTAVNRERHAARGGIERDALARLVGAGRTIAEIALELDRSKATVRYWLGRYGLRTKNRRGRKPTESALAARDAGIPVFRKDCERHGMTDFVLEGRGYYRCARCRMEAVSRRRKKVKQILVAEAGGCCLICGYGRCSRALEFHHLDPTQKAFSLALQGAARSLDAARAEAGKCVLLCSNCHAEVEDGIAAVPIQFDESG